VLIVANETVGAEELLSEIRSFAAGTDAEFFVCVPANPVDTGQAENHGAVYVWEATQRAAQERLDATLAALRADGLRADGALGDFRPLVALDEAAARFTPDGIVISTHPEGRSTWLRQGLVARAREKYDVPVEHIVARTPADVGNG
jgi:GABA permease